MKILPFSIGLGMTILTLFGLLFLLSGCADYACFPARMSGYDCLPPTPKALAEKR